MMKKICCCIIFVAVFLGFFYQDSYSVTKKTKKKRKVVQSQQNIVYQGDREVFYDTRYSPTSYVENPEYIFRFLLDKGFYQQEADQLKDWMDLKITKNAPESVCIMIMGIAPDTIAETMDTKNTKYRYLKAGVKIVWIGDTPFFYQGGMVKTPKKWGSQGLLTVLDIEVIEEDHVSDSAEITDDGIKMGIQVVDKATLPVSMEDVTKTLTKTETLACSWFKNINKEYPDSGFIRYRSTWYDGADNEQNNDLYYLALYPKMKRNADMEEDSNE